MSPDSSYWELTLNRRRAVRWLLEEKMGLQPMCLRKVGLHRKDFAENGLSYLFNQYYNSVGKALREAYHDYYPWELGIVPEKYWTEANANKAVRRVIELKGWDLDTIPKMVRHKKFTRQTFSEFGLASVFEKKFGCNIFKAINAAYPGRYMLWELGNVPAEFWKRRKHLLSALYWIAGREGITENNVFRAVDRKRLTIKEIKKYAIGKTLLTKIKGRLDRLFIPVYAARYGKKKIIIRLENFIRREKQSRSWRLILLYGISYPAVRCVSLEYERRYQRMLYRVKRNELE